MATAQKQDALRHDSRIAAETQVGRETFTADVEFLESLWQHMHVGGNDLPVIDLGAGDPLVFVPIHEHLEFVYARQFRAFCTSRRVILYRRHESRSQFVSLGSVLDALGIASADLVAHGDGAMVLAEFALRYPSRCRSLAMVGLAADYRIAPHPFIWILHELFLRLPIERLVPAVLLRTIIMRYITYNRGDEPGAAAAASTYPRLKEIPRELIEQQFRKIERWPALYRYSVLPVIHSFDIRERLAALTMPILLINRWDDALAPEAKTAWMAQRLPQCVYRVVAGRGRFFMYSEAETITPLIQTFLLSR
jgi:pimeloyl-ACP methyl ester carboxylesterase